MNSSKDLKYSKSIIVLPLIAVILIWLVYIIEIKFGLNFNKFGILPRNFMGLRGVLMSPFIHSNTKHLFNNSVPLFTLLVAIFYFHKEVSYKVLSYGVILTGIFTWIIGRESYHIGASSVVYLLFSFIFFSGLIKRNNKLIALSLATVFYYGSMVWYIFPTKDNISWEGHLSGFLTGLFFAFIYRNKGLKKEQIKFTKTDFDDMFDEEGNLLTDDFIEHSKDADE